MDIQVQFWELLTFLITLLLGFLSFAFVAGRMLLSQVDKRLDQRFAAMEQSRLEGAKHWDEKFAALLDQNKRETGAWQALEKDFLRFQAELPLQYVRREDYVRNQTVIEAKLDAVALKIENIQLRGAQQ